MEEFSKMASSITSYLQFTWDAPDLHEDGRMPVLDTSMWMGTEEREIGVPQNMGTWRDP